MLRLMLSDESWSKLSAILGKINVYHKPNLRIFFEAILYRIRVGCPWRDIPEEFGLWDSLYKKFNNWSKKRIWSTLFDAIANEPDFEWVFIDGSVVKAHQHSAGAASKEKEGIGKSAGGKTTKIHLDVDAHGFPVTFEITGGEVHDSKVAHTLLDKIDNADAIVADKAYGSEKIREQIKKLGGKPVIPRKSNSLVGNDDMDWWLYRYRHLVENAFARLKQFRGVATRYDKLKRNYVSVVALACSYIWLPL